MTREKGDKKVEMRRSSSGGRVERVGVVDEALPRVAGHFIAPFGLAVRRGDGRVGDEEIAM